MQLFLLIVASLCIAFWPTKLSAEITIEPLRYDWQNSKSPWKIVEPGCNMVHAIDRLKFHITPEIDIHNNRFFTAKSSLAPWDRLQIRIALCSLHVIEKGNGDKQNATIRYIFAKRDPLKIGNHIVNVSLLIVGKDHVSPLEVALQARSIAIEGLLGWYSGTLFSQTAEELKELVFFIDLSPLKIAQFPSVSSSEQLREKRDYYYRIIVTTSSLWDSN